MKNFFRAFYKKKWIFWPVIIALVFFILSTTRNEKKITEELLTIGRGDVIETVVATGTVRPKNAASLRFEASGTISKLTSEVGAIVKKGELLATLNAGDLRQRVLQAEAELSVARVALENARQQVGDTEVRNAQNISNTYSSAIAALGDIFNLTQVANNNITRIYTQANIDQSLDASIKLSGAFNTIFYSVKNIVPSSSHEEVKLALSSVYKPLIVMQDIALELLKKLKALPLNTENNEYRDLATQAQSNINEAVAKVITNGKALADLEINERLDSSASTAEYRTAQARIETAQANLEIAKANLANAYLYAPFAGVIATKSKSIGEGVSSADQIYYLIGDGGLKVEANIPEVDIAKIAVGNEATVILDAYGDEDPFEVLITEIDPAETVIDGVATYKTTFSFATEDSRIRSGMTANIIVATQRKENVLVVPMRAVFMKDGQRVVRLIRGEERVDVPVKIGLRGNNGMAEIISGLTDGDVVVIEIKK